MYGTVPNRGHRTYILFPGKEYKYGGLYWAPYRTLYSRNIDNLFMAGRNISVTKTGLGPVRVMRTCGMMGEVVGKAASICIKKGTTPRGVYESHLEQLHKLMANPGSMRAWIQGSPSVYAIAPDGSHKRHAGSYPS